MNATYDPLKDPCSDGYAEVELSKTAWKDGKTEPALFDNPTFMKWFKRGVWVVLAVIVIVVGSCAYKANRDHKAEVATIVNKPVALPELVKPTIVKRIIKKIAPNAVNTPQTTDLVTEKQVSKPVNSDGFTSEFDKRLAEFERKIP